MQAYIVGYDILNLAEVIINANEISVRKVALTIFLAQINVCDGQPLNIGYTADAKTREKIETLVRTYEPNMRAQ